VRSVAQLSFPKPPDGSAQEVTIRITLQAKERPENLDPIFSP
jgi:hypothetical protein